MRSLFTAFSCLLLIGASAEMAAADPSPAQPADVTAIGDIVRAQFDARDLNALIVEVRVDGEPVFSEALGEAMTGVPATTEVRFRNGAVGLAYVAALALKLSEEGAVELDAPISRWLPDLPDADTVTIRMLANMTAGYPDHVANQDGFVEPFTEDPFATWTPDALIAVSLSMPRRFAPGTNWDYSHSDYVILGQVLTAATGKPMHQLMQDYILTPLNLTGTFGFDNAEIPAPVLHGFTAERGFLEDATFWNPSWTLPSGAIQVATISDMAKSFDAIVGADGFLSKAARQAMITPALIGFGAPLEGCPTCHRLTRDFSYGLGTMLQGDWVFQTPLFGGYAASVGTLPEEHNDGRRITIAAVATYRPSSVADWSGALPNWADQTVRLIAAELKPDNPPPMR
ncbi:serine hydrolase domain-containing protein [Martelella sp. HB161492]|uniref:serine hydrolase domain-containing protein n=1 Tax=Martelella sp. HB161492 TaxID=2720726 RepID=UPI001591EA2D|nr:serine hydrolase domain-containing protein [Martelella sp. HB161492]